MGSTIHDFTRNGEIKKEAAHYVATGQLVNDHFWNALEQRRDLNPIRFDRNHPNIAGFFATPKCVGELPNGPILDNLQYRFHLNPNRFTQFHPFWGNLIAEQASCQTPIPIFPMPPEAPPGGSTPVSPQPPIVSLPPPGGGEEGNGGNGFVPEPSSYILMSFAMIWVGLLFWIRRISC